MEKTAKVLRVLTVPNLMAAIMAAVLGYTSRISWYEAIIMIFFLGIFPCFAYILAYIVPKWREEGRTMQRKLAVVFSVTGYVGGIAAAFLCNMSIISKVVYLTYLLSGAFIFISSALGFPASGHSCGVAGPVAILCVYVSLWWLFGIAAEVLAFVSSLTAKRHTFLQLTAGCAAALCAFFIALFILT